MSFLLDTQAFVLWTLNDPRLPQKARAAIADPHQTIVLSAVSVWEIRIKAAKGKLQLSYRDVPAEAERHGFELLSISAAHAQRAGDLPPHHEDPFDRVLVAQSLLEDLTIIGGDRMFDAYGVPLLWS